MLVEQFNYAPLDWDRMNAAFFYDDADGPANDALRSELRLTSDLIEIHYRVIEQGD